MLCWSALRRLRLPRRLQQLRRRHRRVVEEVDAVELLGAALQQQQEQQGDDGGDGTRGHLLGPQRVRPRHQHDDVARPADERSRCGRRTTPGKRRRGRRSTYLLPDGVARSRAGAAAVGALDPGCPENTDMEARDDVEEPKGHREEPGVGEGVLRRVEHRRGPVAAGTTRQAASRPRLPTPRRRGRAARRQRCVYLPSMRAASSGSRRGSRGTDLGLARGEAQREPVGGQGDRRPSVSNDKMVRCNLAMGSSSTRVHPVSCST